MVEDNSSSNNVSSSKSVKDLSDEEFQLRLQQLSQKLRSQEDVDNLQGEDKEIFDEYNRRNQVLQNAVMKAQSGKESELNDEEKKAYQGYKQQVDAQNAQFDAQRRDIEREQFQTGKSMEEIIQERNFKEAETTLRAQGGKKLLHITDSEVEAQDLEQRLQALHLKGRQSIDKDEIMVHTGDLTPDLFNLKKNRLQAYLPEVIAAEGELTKEETEEFRELYQTILKESGITEEELKSGKVQNQQGLQAFQMLLYGHMEPRFKSKGELEEYRGKKKSLDKILKKAIKNHAKRNYTQIKQVYEKYGLTPENTVIIGGNHDVPEVMREILGEYMVDEGKTKEVRGVKFGLPLDKATGAVYGPAFQDVMGYNELTEDLPTIRYNTEAFSDLKSYLVDNGFDSYSDQHLDQLIKTSVSKRQFGLGSSHLENYNHIIEAQVQDKVIERLEKLEENIPYDADILLGHGDITHAEHAGLEETRLRQLLKNKGVTYIGGHQHGNTTNKQDENLFINPGATADFKSGQYLLNQNNEFEQALFSDINQMTGGLSYRSMNKNEIPAMTSGEYQKGGQAQQYQ